MAEPALPPQAGIRRVWRLRVYLSALLVLALLVAFGVVGSTILAFRIPQIEQESREQVTRDVSDLTIRVEILLGSLEARMQLLSAAMINANDTQAAELLDSATWDGRSFRAIYLTSDQGVVLSAGVFPELKANRATLIGSDLSASALFRAVQTTRGLVWGEKYLSSLTGAVTVGVAFPVGRDRMLLAEVPLEYLLSTVQSAVGERTSLVWLVDHSGEVLADTEGGRHVGRLNLMNLPLFQAAVNDQQLPDLLTFEGNAYYPALSRSNALNWYFIGGMPAGLQNLEIRRAVLFVVQGFLGSLLIGLLMAPFWASWLVRPLRGIVARAEQVTRGESPGGQWPRGQIAEFNALSSDIEAMASTLQEREQKFLAIFNTSPIPVSVTNTNRGFELLDVNDAWSRTFGWRREEVLGKTGAGLGMVHSTADWAAAFKGMKGDSLIFDSPLCGSDGVALMFKVYIRRVVIGNASLMIWAAIDISEFLRVDDELRELNAELEARVERRTQALADLNTELTGTMANLRETQLELVQAEKMAALGGLVAGVAHELNTPLGNSLMAVSALNDDARQFSASMQSGLRRSALDNFLASVTQATSIATRNLHRAADLVTSFKQVAVDQTSDQRRRFELGEVVREMVMSLGPTLSRTPFKVEVDVPLGLQLDSYPGALGQVIANLVNNAVLHGFEGRSHGRMRITGTRADDGAVVLTFSDDGKGIPAGLLDRIFDPFVTTKKGHGGTGLGLHISYNAVVNLMGGSLKVHSVEGEGATFTLRLPPTAPLVSANVPPSG